MIILNELFHYSKMDLENKILNENEDINILDEIIGELLKKNIIKYDSKGFIQFDYVGIILIKNKSIFILPKYVTTKNKNEKIDILKKIIKLLNNFTEKENLNSSQIEDIDLEKESLENNLLSIVTFLLDDYLENGIYINEIFSTELNGDGEINWNETIEKIDPIVISNQWFYSEFITNNSEMDINRFITRVHGRIINECIEFLNKTGLIDFLGYKDIEIIENSLEDLEEIERIEFEIEKETRTQFNDRKKRVLYSIKSYLDKKSGTEDDGLLLYGTRNFKWIWEVICGNIFDNEFIKTSKESKYEKYGIESPKWYINNTNIDIDDSKEYNLKKNRLTPDILKFIINKEERTLLILDAKYYCVRLENNKLEGNPGIDDITKQYLYHTALKKYIENNNINKVINAFLFPSELKTYVQGEVVLDFMKEFSDININLIQLNADEIINMYCSNKKYNMKDFVIMIDTWNDK